MTATAVRGVEAAVERLDVSVYTVPSDCPESDGTAEWDSTTMVLVEAHAGDWDLKARLLELPLATLLDAAHDTVPVYGSGGFTSYPDERIAEQLGGWAEQGIPRVKIKVGREPERDLHRIEVARSAIGAGAELFVDASGALSRKQAAATTTRTRSTTSATRRACSPGR